MMTPAWLLMFSTRTVISFTWAGFEYLRQQLKFIVEEE
jgi:hypothetical protein